MNDLPAIVPKNNLTHFWWYRDISSEPFGLVTRYDVIKEKSKSEKWYHQYQLVNGEWVEGATTPLPIFGLHLLPNHDSDEIVFIFEGEKCAQAAHHLDLTAITTMRGAYQAEKADWSILARFSNCNHFVLVPDNDEAGMKYMRNVSNSILKISPEANIALCQLPLSGKGDDFIDWIKSSPNSPPNWDGFSPVDEPHSEYIRKEFLDYVSSNSILASTHFAKDNSSKPTFSNPPEPIEKTILPVKPCPSHCFPSEIIEWLRIHAKQMQIPLDYLAAPLIVYTGSVIGRKRGLRVRPGTDWVEFPNLWGMIIGRPSFMKSPAMQVVQKPLNHLIAEDMKKHKEDEAEYKLRLEHWKILKKVQEDHLKKKLSKRIDDGEKINTSQIFDHVIEEEPSPPRYKRYKTDDATVEKLGELLIDNPKGLLLFRDELSGWLYSFEKTGRENDRPFFLESWSGKQDFNVDRIGRGSLYIPALCLSIFGSIQPGPLSQYIRAAIQGGVGDDGFIQRFQIMVWPDASPKWELIKIESPIHLEEKIIDIFQFLDQLDFDSESRPVYLEFDDEAQLAFDSWQTGLENRLRGNDLLPHLESHIAKYKKLVPALSLIFQLLIMSAKREEPHQVTFEALRLALDWADYLESHAMRVYHSSKNMIPKIANELLKRLKKGEVKEPFSCRDIYCGHHWSGLATTEEVREVLEYLCERNYLIGQIIKTGGRSSMKYWIHPYVFEN